MTCDNCNCYHWYYDYCDKWKCKVDSRCVHNCIEPRQTPMLDAMVHGATEKERKHGKGRLQ